jgi:hypothetical protein
MTAKTDGAAARRSGARVSGRGAARAAAVEQPSRADRVAIGELRSQIKAKRFKAAGTLLAKAYTRDSTQDKPLFLQAKKAQPSVLAEYAGRSQHDNQGERVVAGQHLMQAENDIFLGWIRAPSPDGVDRDFYAWRCGWTLARAHARSRDRIALAACLGGSGKFDEATARLSPRRRSKMASGAAHPGGDMVMSEAARAQRPGAAEPRRRRNFGGRESRYRR